MGEASVWDFSHSTQWTLFRRAHEGEGRERETARNELLELYRRPVRGYLGKALRDPDDADELTHWFVERFLEGRFRGADPEKGRFRDYVRKALANLIADFKKKQKRHLPLPPGHDGPAARDPLPDLDPVLRDDFLNRAWKKLAAFEHDSGRPLHTVLRLRAEHPDMKSEQLAEQLGRVLGKPFTAEGARQVLHRAREEFADLLIGLVAGRLKSRTREDLEEELRDLGLLPYCRPALERFQPRG